MKKDFLSFADLASKELLELLELAAKLKKKPLGKQLSGKAVALVFEKPSTRTRVSFEAGIAQLGGQPIYIDSRGTQLSRGESIEDFAHTLERYVECICARVFEHKTLEVMAKSAGIPVVNMLSDKEHPCQTLADLLTIKERFGKLEQVKVAYIGDGNNVCNSLLLGCAMAGVNITAACPAGYEPLSEIVSKAENIAASSGCAAGITHNPKEAAKGADVIYNDTFVSMGQEKEGQERLKAFIPEYQITKGIMSLAKKSAVYMHCLPAHRGQEVLSEVIDGPQSIVFDQAENRLHAQKALLINLVK